MSKTFVWFVYPLSERAQHYRLNTSIKYISRTLAHKPVGEAAPVLPHCGLCEKCSGALAGPKAVLASVLSCLPPLTVAPTECKRVNTQGACLAHTHCVWTSVHLCDDQSSCTRACNTPHSSAGWGQQRRPFAFGCAGLPALWPFRLSLTLLGHLQLILPFT